MTPAALLRCLYAAFIVGFGVQPQAASAGDSIDPSLIPDGSYPAHVDKVIDPRHLAVTMQGSLKIFLASGRASVRFDKIKANDNVVVTLADGKVMDCAKK